MDERFWRRIEEQRERRQALEAAMRDRAEQAIREQQACEREIAEMRQRHEREMDELRRREAEKAAMWEALARIEEKLDEREGDDADTPGR